MAWADELVYRRERRGRSRTLALELKGEPPAVRHERLRAFEAETTATLDRMVAERVRERREGERRAARVRLVKSYGMTVAEYEALERQQGGRCAVCKGSPRKHGLAIDHCHRTGAVRGLLCSRCNTTLGMVGDSVSLLMALIRYLRAGGEGDAE